jgi:hypothetical protein
MSQAGNPLIFVVQVHGPGRELNRIVYRCTA